jgi:hypothetical protein
MQARTIARSNCRSEAAGMPRKPATLSAVMATARASGRQLDVVEKPWRGPSWNFANMAVVATAPAKSGVVQPKCQHGDRCTSCSGKAPESSRRVLPTLADIPEVESTPGQPLAPTLAARAQRVFGVNFSNVGVETGSAAQVAARRLNARAFAVDNRIFFGTGQYQPASREGLTLIGHELAHVAQQRSGLSTTDLRGAGDRFEQEAERAGRAFAADAEAGLARPTPHPFSPAKKVIASARPAMLRAVQLSEDPGADAARVGVDDSPSDLPFLGEAMTGEELVALMRGLAVE